MTDHIQLSFRRFPARHMAHDSRTVSGHQKIVTDAVQVNDFGQDPASIWFSFRSRSSILVAKLVGITYHSEAAKHGGWSYIMSSALDTVKNTWAVDPQTLSAVSLIYDVVDDDLNQFRAVHTWTPAQTFAGYCTLQAWKWRWLDNPQSNTQDEIQRIIFTTKEEETRGT